MLKRSLSIILIIILCVSFVGCSKQNETKIDVPLILINEVRDSYDNIIQQTFYNSDTDEYMVRSYEYALCKNKWVCTNQHMSIIPFKKELDNISNISEIDRTLKIYYNSDLEDGPITVMDNDFVKVSIVKYLAKDNWWEFGYELKVTNKTNSVITYMIDGASIMDIQCQPLFSIDHIEAGDTAYFTMAWDTEALERSHIPYVDNVEFMLRIYNNDRWTSTALAGSIVLMKK